MAEQEIVPHMKLETMGFESVKREEDIESSRPLGLKIKKAQPQKGVVKMPQSGKTFMFPREDTAFKSKESIPYDESQTQIWLNRPRLKQYESFKEW